MHHHDTTPHTTIVWSLRRAVRGGMLFGLTLGTALGLSLAAPARAAPKSGIGAVFDPASGALVVSGDENNNTIVISRDAAGAIVVNAGRVPVAGAQPTITNTRLIEVHGRGKNDTLKLDETNGPLPDALILGGEGNDTVIGGSGNDRLHGEGGNDQISWRTADGSGLVEGGEGNDTLKVVGADEGEAFTGAGDGLRLRLERTAPSPGALDIGAVETLLLELRGGRDSLTLGPNLAPLSRIGVNGGDGDDAITVNGDAAAEIFTLTAASASARLERTDPSPFSLGMGMVEELALISNGGDDRFAAGIGLAQGPRVTVDGALVGEGEAIVEGDGEGLAPGGAAGIIASYSPASSILTVFGNAADNVIEVTRDSAGKLLVNGGAVRISGGTPTVANTTLIQLFAQGGNDTGTLNEGQGALPRANMFGSSGNDVLTAGSGADQLFGQAGNDTLLGKGGVDALFGGTENDTLTGGDADDQAFGEGGDDRIIWNPGDDTDLNEGGDGTDTVEVNGGGGAEVFTTTANGTRVRFDRLDPAPFALDINAAEKLVLSANGGDDSFSAVGNLAALIQITVDGGPGGDTLLGSNGADLLIGGDQADFIDGQQGNDVAFLGTGDDSFQWDPGDGSDTVEGQDGADQLLFNGSNGAEVFEAAANGGRVRFTRNLGTIVMDLDDVERLGLKALGSADTLIIDDLSGTDLVAVDADLAGTFGGSTGDAAADVVIVNGRNADDSVDIHGTGTAASVIGLPALVNIANAEGANDSLVVNALGGADTLNATALTVGIVKLTLDGGAGNDTLLGSNGADVLLGGSENDVVEGQQGNDVAFLGAGDDSFQWDPGDGNDTVEGQDGSDSLRFNGSADSENIDIVANGGRVIFFRNLDSVLLDLDDVELLDFYAVDGADNIVVGDLGGTDVGTANLDLGTASGGQANAIAVNGTQGDDTITAATQPNTIVVAGLGATVNIFHAEQASDRLTLNGLGGADVIDGTALGASSIQLIMNGGLGVDVLRGSAGGDLFNGGDGNDGAYMGDGDDTFVWNPGDDNDTVEGEAGFDTLLFNGANVAENIDISANGGHVRFFRDIANVVMDLTGLERVNYAALGGADTVTVGDLSGTDASEVNVALQSSLGGGDGMLDRVIVHGTGGEDVAAVLGAGSDVSVIGLAVTVALTGAEAANDALDLRMQGGDDAVDATGLITTMTLVADAGAGNDVVLGGAGNDIVSGGVGDDTLEGGAGNDTLDGGEGSDVLVGGDGTDVLLNGEVLID